MENSNTKHRRHKRKYPFGAEPRKEGVDFRLWAPACQEINLVINQQKIQMEKEKEGVFFKFVPDAKVGMTYQYELNGTDLIPDPCSRYQPRGAFGPSLIVDLEDYLWQDKDWSGKPSLKGEVFYELHIGTFTKEGTWAAATEKLSYLSELGITIIEMMPIAEWEGKFGWGYDGFLFFAPTANYGTIDDLRDFIEQAHKLDLSVILDVVYNHVGPDFDLYKKLSKDCFVKEQNEWGQCINYDSEHVRAHIVSNVLYWLEEYHFDGLRFDAAQNIVDESEKHILRQITDIVKEHTKNRHYLLVAEDESERIQLVEEDGFGLDGIWDDDFHHSANVALTGKREAYYHDYHGTLQELLSSIKYGFLYQGQYYPWQKKKRGTPSLNTPLEKYIIYLENHDQVANSTTGRRLHQLSNLSLLRALTTLFLLAPQTPLLFQGQEFGSSKPFLFFADHDPFLNRLTGEGRKKFMEQFDSLQSIDPLNFLDPGNEEIFHLCKLDWNELEHAPHQHLLNFHKELLDLRKKEAIFCDSEKVDGALLNPNLLVLRYFGKEGEDIIMVCNFGKDVMISSCSEPLIAPPLQKSWSLFFSSNELRCGGVGYPQFKEGEWIMPAYTTHLFKGEAI